MMVMMMIMMMMMMMTTVQVPADIHSALDLVCSERRSVGTSPAHLVLALTLLAIQVFRRLYECAVINQPSSSTMNITHYIVGYAHYFCTATGFLCEAPGFVTGSSTVSLSEISAWSVSWSAWPATLILVVAWYQQLEAHKEFARLKMKNSAGHSIPSGGLFEYVSCPHYLCEVIIYTCLLAILGTHHHTAWLGNYSSEYINSHPVTFTYCSVVLGVDQPVDSRHHESQVVQGEVQGVPSSQEGHHTLALVIFCNLKIGIKIIIHKNIQRLWLLSS